MDTVKLLFKVNRDTLDEKLKLIAAYNANEAHPDLIAGNSPQDVIVKLEQEAEVCRDAIRRLSGMGIPRLRSM